MFVSRLKWLAIFILVAGLLGLVFISFNAVFAADRTSTTTTPTCRDTDGGEDVYVKGTLSVYTPTYGNQTVVESCADTRTMDELVCLTGDPTYAYTHKKTACGNGCKDGACLKPKTCSETDRGNNKMLKGTNTIYNGDGTVFTTGVDYCFDRNTVAEMTCNGGQWNITYEDCGDGYTCDLGACKAVVVETPKPSCRDTDGGNEVYTKGTLSVYTPTYGNQTVIEACADDKTMDELVCLIGDPTYAYTHSKTACRYGCKDGACIATAPVVVAPVVRYDATAKSAFMAPSDGAILTNYPREAELQWTPITSASKYEVEVACDVCGSTRWGDVSKLTSGAVYLTTPALAGDNQFRARVRALYPDNTYSQWSDYLYFSYKTTPTLIIPTEPVATQPKLVEPKAVEPTTETTVQTNDQTQGEAVEEVVTEEAQIVVESKPTVAPKVAEKKVGRMSCGNSAGGDGLYSACVKDTIKLDNKINITVRTYSGNYAWLTIKGAKKAYYRIKLGDNIDVVSKKGADTINVTYVKKSPKFGVFLQIETAE